MSWTYYAKDQSPAAVATVFAAGAFNEPREVDAQGVSGGWVGKRYYGRFQLKDGYLIYGITGQDGMWEISVQEGAD